jgi:hypothetical protein
MFVGHFGLGLAAKRVVPAVSLGTLFLSVQLADGLWPLFLLLGLEHVRIVPGLMAASPLDFTDYPFSHSLVTLAGWGVAFGTIYWLIRRNRWAALVLAGGVVSHWLLDVIVHRPDLPVFPHGPYLGLGLWQSIPATLAVEGALYLGGLALYLTATRAKDRIGHYALWSLYGLLAALWIGGLLGPPPPNERMLAFSGLAMWITIPWAYWIDRHRSPRGPFRRG